MKRRSICTLLLSLLLLFALPLSALAAGKGASVAPVKYVSIGDSVASGYSASTGNSFYSKFSKYLEAKALTANASYSSANTASPGLTTTQLKNEVLGSTSTTQTRTQLAGATIVTINVGGNNLMYPLINYVATLYGVPKTPEDTFMIRISAAVNADSTKLTNAMMWQMLLPNSQLKLAFAAGVKDFKSDLPVIVSGIKTLSPSAKIYFLNQYNPLYGNAQLRSFINGYIVQMNYELKARTTTYGYTLVDVYTAFNAYTGTAPLVGFNMAATTATFDPHPTDAGHQVIYNLLVSASTQPVRK